MLNARKFWRLPSFRYDSQFPNRPYLFLTRRWKPLGRSKHVVFLPHNCSDRTGFVQCRQVISLNIESIGDWQAVENSLHFDVVQCHLRQFRNGEPGRFKEGRNRLLRQFGWITRVAYFEFADLRSHKLRHDRARSQRKAQWLSQCKSQCDSHSEPQSDSSRVCSMLHSVVQSMIHSIHVSVTLLLL